jgi:hypothetical protein
MMDAMIDLFCDSFAEVPRRILLDIDDTEDRVHGGAGEMMRPLVAAIRLLPDRPATVRRVVPYRNGLAQVPGLPPLPVAHLGLRRQWLPGNRPGRSRPGDQAAFAATQKRWGGRPSTASMCQGGGVE